MGIDVDDIVFVASLGRVNRFAARSSTGYLQNIFTELTE